MSTPHVSSPAACLRRCFPLVRIFAFALLCAGVLFPVARGETAESKIAFDVPAGEAGKALKLFARQAQREVLFATELTGGVRTNAVQGSYTLQDGLQQLLAGTALSAHIDLQTGGLVVQRDNAEKAKNAARAVPVTDRPAADKSVTRTDDGALQLATFEVFDKKTLNMDVLRTKNDPQPYYIFTSAQIERSGSVNVEDFLKQQLTMNATFATNAQTYASSNGNTSTINLRGLGANETLILVDGRRAAAVPSTIPGGSPVQPDVNGIPLSAVERIEVLPSSASAIYGGAAAGGVVNIVLKRNYTGGEITYTYDHTASGSAFMETVSGVVGASFKDGKTQIMIGGQYSDAKPLLLKERAEIYKRGISTILKNDPSFLYASVNPFRGATPNIAAPVGNLVLRNGTPLNSPITSISPGAAPGSDINSGLVANAGTYNLNISPGTGVYGGSSPFGSIPSTKSLFGSIRQTIFRDVQLFGQFSNFGNSSSATLNPFSPGFFTVQASSPINPFQQSVRISVPSNVQSVLETRSLARTAAIGAVIPLTSSWAVECDYTWSESNLRYGNPQSDTTALNAALNNGTLNPFVDTIAYPLNFQPYQRHTTFNGSSTINDLSVRASGSLVQLPAGAVSFNVGFEHRKEGTGDAVLDSYNTTTTANDTHLVYFGQSQDIEALFFESRVPIIVPAQRIPGIHSAELQIATRGERYSTSTGTPYRYLAPAAQVAANPAQGVHQEVKYTSTNPTIGLKYQPIGDFTFRASYGRAFLPPNASQLLPSASSTFSSTFVIVDPKSGASYPVTYIAGGNPSLRPQAAKNWNLGVLWAPDEGILKGLRVGAEYYYIVQPDYITTPTPQLVVSTPALSSRVTRDPSTGLITLVDSSIVNATEYRTDGWDLSLDYHRRIRNGTLTASSTATYILHDLRQYAIGSPFLDYAGYPNDGGEEKLKINGTFGYEWENWIVAWTTTYYSHYTQTYAPGSPSALQNGLRTTYTAPQGSFTIPSQSYSDIFVGYSFAKSRGKKRDGLAEKVISSTTLQLGVKNVFNKIPPFDAGFGTFYYSPLGDPRLRHYWASVKIDF